MAEPVLVKNDRDPLFGWTPQRFEGELRRLLAGRVAAAYVFGSYGTSDFGPDSDIDLILVTPTAKPFIGRPFDYFDLLDLGPALDLLVYTPDEFAQLTTDPSPGFWRSVTANLRRLI